MQQQQEFRAGSLPRSVRKESTSFEHSEPLPGNLTRWPLDGAGSGSGTGSGSRRPGESFVELTVTLQRHDSGFGFRIVGGTEEGSQVSFLSLLAKNLKKSIPKKLVKLLRNFFFVKLLHCIILIIFNICTLGFNWSYRSWRSGRLRRPIV